MMLGDLLGAARDSAPAFQAWLATRNPDLAARVAQAADREGLGAAGFVRAAVSGSDLFASEEDWATLTSRLRGGGADPGLVCLAAMVEWRVKAPDAHARHHPAPDQGTHP
jgi:hypothetical protein